MIGDRERGEEKGTECECDAPRSEPRIPRLLSTHCAVLLTLCAGADCATTVRRRGALYNLWAEAAEAKGRGPLVRVPHSMKES